MITREIYLLAIGVIKEYHLQVQSDLRQNKKLEVDNYLRNDLSYAEARELKYVEIPHAMGLNRLVWKASSVLNKPMVDITIGDLEGFTRAQYFKWNNIGKGTIKLLEDFFMSYNIDWDNNNRS